MKAKNRGRRPIEIIESVPYSQIIFLISAGINYPIAISKARGIDNSSTFKQLEELRKKGFLNTPIRESLLNKTIYSVNWKKIIGVFIDYIIDQCKYISSENERLSLNLPAIFRGFDKSISYMKDKDFQDRLKENKYLQTFFQSYYAEIGRLKENWSIIVTFDFLSFFGGLDFIYSLTGIHDFYNIERLIRLKAIKEHSNFPEWLLNAKEPTNEKESFERYKQVHAHTSHELKKQEEEINEQIENVLQKNPDIEDLFILTKILQIIKLKPTLQLGLNTGIKEAGKQIFQEVFTKEQIQDYIETTEKYSPGVHSGIPIEELKEKLEKNRLEGKNSIEGIKPEENEVIPSRNTHQIKQTSNIKKKK